MKTLKAIGMFGVALLPALLFFGAAAWGMGAAEGMRFAPPPTSGR